MTATLPAALKQAIATAVGPRGGKELRHGAGRLSDHYRAGGGSGAGLDFGAYLAARMPATYAAVARVLTELTLRQPGFAPSSLLDAGAGPGTASWAAAALWPGLARFTFLDNNPAFLDLAGELASASENAALAAAERRLGRIENSSPEPASDLVVAAYALAELPVSAADAAALSLWRAAGQALVIVEPGTPQGFQRILKARDALIRDGAKIVAPCPHAGPCLLTTPDWCHFSVRLPRSRQHMQAKGARVPFEDEKFAYVIACREALAQPSARILAPPTETKAEIRFKLCAPEGIASRVIARRDRDAYKRARKLKWGDRIERIPKA